MPISVTGILDIAHVYFYKTLLQNTSIKLVLLWSGNP